MCDHLKPYNPNSFSCGKCGGFSDEELGISGEDCKSCYSSTPKIMTCHRQLPPSMSGSSGASSPCTTCEKPYDIANSKGQCCSSKGDGDCKACKSPKVSDQTIIVSAVGLAVLLLIVYVLLKNRKML